MAVARVIGEDFHALFETPDVVKPFLYRIVHPDEEELIRYLGKTPKTAADTAGHFGISEEAGAGRLADAYHRAVINKSREDPSRYVAGNLYTRLGYFTQYEPEVWQDIHTEDRRRIDDWYIDEFTRRLKESIDQEKEHFFRDTVLPIRQAREKIEEIGKTLDKPFYIVPCNCRTTTKGCHFSIDTCIANNYNINGQWDRGHGRQVTVDEVKELLDACDREGLMHTVAPNGHICNCETCCCYEFRGALKLGTKGLYPRVEYIAQFDESLCINCGKCAARCHFNAFQKVSPKKVAFHPELCWGCGICECTCPKKAITIVPLNTGGAEAV